MITRGYAGCACVCVRACGSHANAFVVLLFLKDKIQIWSAGCWFCKMHGTMERPKGSAVDTPLRVVRISGPRCALVGFWRSLASRKWVLGGCGCGWWCCGVVVCASILARPSPDPPSGTHRPLTSAVTSDQVTSMRCWPHAASVPVFYHRTYTY